ncbi:MAG: hypothetical protein ACE5OZ_00870 [Candidatus Heimdallarchaeota archaeon]
MPSTELFQGLIDAIEAIVKKADLTDRTGPTIKTRGQSKTLAYNLFLNTPRKLLKSLKEAVDSTLEGLNGEIICLEGEGAIVDSGITAFHVAQSVTWDVYLYDPEDFLYIRLFHEKDPEKGVEWLSLDADYVANSAWFQNDE